MASELEVLQQKVAALEAESTRLRALLEATPDLVVRVAIDGTYRDVMEGRNTVVVVSRSERVGKKVSDLLPAAVAAKYDVAVRQAVSTGLTQSFDYELTLNGKSGHYEARASRSADDEAVVVIRDVSERRQVEAALREEKERSEALLLNMLPRAIVAKLRDNPGTIAERFDDGTILFADIVGFTNLSSKTPPAEVVGLLNEIFTAFDRLTLKFGLEKIKTIGDAYMVVGGVPTPRDDHAEAVAEMALSMLDAVAEVSRTRGPYQVRIGINSGPVVAGVLGLSKFVYDLWGDAVNVAARMESHGHPGSIQVSEETHRRLESSFLFESRGMVDVKGKGPMRTFFLKGRK
jgi:urea transport system substrate-binding protein